MQKTVTTKPTEHQHKILTNITQKIDNDSEEKKDFITKIIKKQIENEEIIELNNDNDSDLDEDVEQQLPNVFIKTYTDELKPKIELIKTKNENKDLIENFNQQQKLSTQKVNFF